MAVQKCFVIMVCSIFHVQNLLLIPLCASISCTVSLAMQKSMTVT